MSSLPDSPVQAWSGEVFRLDGRELVVGLDRPTDGLVALIVHLPHVPPLQCCDRVRVLGQVLPGPVSPVFEPDPADEETEPARRVREVTGIGVHRRRWASAWSHWRRRRARRVRERWLGLR